MPEAVHAIENRPREWVPGEAGTCLLALGKTAEKRAPLQAIRIVDWIGDGECVVSVPYSKDDVLPLCRS
jgi:hypothetical protein